MVMITTLNKKGYPINEQLVAELIDQFPTETQVAFIEELSPFRSSNWVFDGLESETTHTVSLHVVFAHMRLMSLDEDSCGLGEAQRSLRDRPTKETLDRFLGDGLLQGRYDARTIAFLLRKCDNDARRVYLGIIDKGRYRDYNDLLILREDVEAHLEPLFDSFSGDSFKREELYFVTAQGLGHALSRMHPDRARDLITSPPEGQDPLVILAYYRKIPERNSLFRELRSMDELWENLANPEKLFILLGGRHDPKIWAMLLDQMSKEQQQAMFECLESQSPLMDQYHRPVTIEVIKAEMTPPKSPGVEVITKVDLLMAGASTLVTLVISITALSALTLAGYGLGWLWARKSATLILFKWGWGQTKQGASNHPALKGIFATAITAGAGYSTGIMITDSDRVAKAAAFVFTLLAVPYFSKHYFSYEMGKGEALTSLLAGLLLFPKDFSRGRRRRDIF